MRAILIPENPGKPIQEVTVGDEIHTTLRDIQSLLGSDFEIVRTRQLHSLMDSKGTWTRYPTTVMLVDEEGHKHGRRLNARASVFYDGDIVGTAVLFDEIEVEGAGDIASLSDHITVDAVNAAIVRLYGSDPGDRSETVGQDVEPV